MEYSKEDLMEAKRQILGVGENMGTEESKKIWEKNAQFWDNAMGDKSNEFHREVVRPKVTELLSPNPADYILDIACGNGNYSSYLAQRGASIVAFDYSKKMIELAKRRQSQYAKQIEFCVADATNRESILELKRNRAFTKAVSNMAIMDITDIEPLLMAVYELLEESGIFVFATQHPCFITLTEKYMTPHSYYGSERTPRTAEGGFTMRKRYNTPHRSRVVKTRMTEEEYAEFAERLSAYNMSQAEFIRQAITGAAIRPIITVSPVNDELLAAVGKLTAEYGRIGGNLNQID